MKKNTYIRLTNLFRSKLTKYIVDYKVEDDKIRIISSLGDTKIVKNSDENIAKLNHVIVKNKIMIAKQIDDYNDTFKERLMILFMDLLILCIAGVAVPFAFFTGNYFFFLMAVIVFSLAVITTSVIIVDYYILVMEIQMLKKLTGYKKDTEFTLHSFSIKNIKSH